MRGLFAVVLVVLCSAGPLRAAEGTISVPSGFGVEETADRLESVLKEKGMTVFNRIRHSEAAREVGVELRGTELVLFGNPGVGSALMKCQQSVGIDLPLKALVWEDEAGRVQVSYNDPRYLERRHGITGCEEVLMKMEKALAGIVAAAAGSQGATDLPAPRP